MYIPPEFAIDDRATLHAVMAKTGLATLVSATADGPVASELPLLLDPDEGAQGTLHGHLARANRHWKADALGDMLAIFRLRDFYVTPAWYASKAEHGKVVPTWNYVTVQARGRAEFFDDPERLLEVVTRLTDRHEDGRWRVSDAPERYIASQLRGIIGLRLEITAMSGKAKMSQNKTEADLQGVRAGAGAAMDDWQG